MPLLLLAGAAIEPSATGRGPARRLGAAALAALTLRLVRGWWALAVACAITVVAYAIDVVAGSDADELSLLGPNPVFGVRFYGIGNELEALFAVMVPVGVGAGLSAYSGWGREVSRRVRLPRSSRQRLVTAVVFAAGRFGADVGAAIVLPGRCRGSRRVLPGSVSSDFRLRPGKSTNLARGRLAVTLIAASIAGLVLLAFIDLVSGGNAHLTRSVLDAGGAGDLADVAQRRLELSAHDFAQAAGNPLFWIVDGGHSVGASVGWRRIDAWLQAGPNARAGLIGACAAVAVGVIVNDSGATFLTLGALALGAALAFAWAQAGQDVGSSQA